MTADIVNLRQVRKQKKRAKKEQTAAANRARHGRSGAERRRDDAIRDLDTKALDGVRRDANGDGGEETR